MTMTTLDACPDTNPDIEAVADTVARMLDTADRLRSDQGAIGWLSLLLADARLLSRLVPAVRPTIPAEDDQAAGRALLEDVLGRLWMAKGACA